MGKNSGCPKFKLGVIIIAKGKRKFIVDETFFDEIDTEEKAYWLGFLYADGCVTKDGNTLIVNLSPVDVEHLELLNRCLSSNYPIKTMDSGRYVSLQIHSGHLVRSLNKHGCVPHKSLILRFPEEGSIPCDLIHHFIRGYFDGDGCISTILYKKKNRNNKTMNCEINFLGTNDMLNGILKYIPIHDLRIFEYLGKSINSKHLTRKE